MESTHQGIMDRQGDTADVDALVNYIKEVSKYVGQLTFGRLRLVAMQTHPSFALSAHSKQLEINLAKKDELLKVKDYQIESLHAEVSGKKGSNTAAQVFRGRVADGAVTPRNNLESNQTLVSDDSGEVEASIDEESLSLSLSLSHDLSHISKISKVGSSSEENSPSDQEASRDGRWNIPFDGTEFEELVAKAPPGKSARNALRDIGFVPIKEGRPVRLSTSEPVTPVRPIPRIGIVSSPFAAARRGDVLKDLMKDKENVSPKRSSISPTIQSLRVGILLSSIR